MSFTWLHYHIVFSTKDRRPILTSDLLPRTCQYMGGIARNLKGRILLANGVADHVHLAASIHPTIAVAEFLQTVKANTSGWVHENFPDMADFAWQEGYSAFTVSKAVLPDVLKYIEGQEAHHRKRPFKKELLELLRLHDVEYDPRYIWK